MELLNKDHWLSSILEKSVFQIDFRFVSQLAFSNLPQGPALLMAKVPVASVQECKHLQALNFFLVDTNVQLQKVRKRTSFLLNGFNIRFSAPSDQEMIIKIAANSFTYDRFHGDPNITQKKAEKIKVEWAKNYYKNIRGDWMVVAECEGIIYGFLQLLHGDDGALVIDLIAVDKSYRHIGVAQKMIDFAVQNCITKTEVVRVGTQIANLPSISLYLKMGFSIISAQYVFHCHL